MIVRNVADLAGTDREVDADNWTSFRMLLKRDGMGFSFHLTVIRPGTETRMQYLHHLEAVFCVEGKGSLHDLATDAQWTIEPGVMYALDQHDDHVLRATTPLRLLCVFNPPVTGAEVHDERGAYPPELVEAVSP